MKIPYTEVNGSDAVRWQRTLRETSLGFTLVEVMMTVAVIALLAVIIVPALSMAARTRENAKCAIKLRVAIEAFELYAADNGDYPPDSTPGIIPPEMKTYYFPYYKIDEWWTLPTELGGKFDWDLGYNFTSSVSLSRPTASQKQLIEFDALVDNGDLATGKFRQVGRQFHYILEE